MGHAYYEEISQDAGRETRKSHNTRNIFSLLTFSWVSGVFKAGSRRPLQQSDFLDLPEQDETKHLTVKLQKGWKHEVARSRKNGCEPRLWKIVLKLLSPHDIFFAIFTGLVDSVSRFTQPLLLGYFLSLLMHPDDSHRYLLYGCAGIMMATVTVRSLAMHQYDYNSLYLGMRLRSALKGIVYIKILLLGQNTLRSFTTGHVVDLVSNDVQRMDRAVMEFFRLWLSVFELVCLTPLMLIIIGWQAVIGLMCLMLFSPISAYLSYLSGDFRIKTADVTDRRLNLLTEVISGIRAVKANALEWLYGDKITYLRRREMEIIRWKSVLLSCLFTISFHAHTVPTFVAVLLLTVSHQHLTPVNVFMLLALLSMLKSGVLKFLGDGCQALYESYASVERIQQFLLLENLPPIPKSDSTENLVFEGPPTLQNIAVVNNEGVMSGRGCKPIPNNNENVMNDPGQKPTCDTVGSPEKRAAIQSDVVREAEVEESLNPKLQRRSMVLKNVTCRAKGDTKFILEDVSFELHDSDFIVVTGAVGSGKSTLLSSIIGETTLASGTIKCTSSIAYVPQTPWIYSGNLRENILFGQPFHKEWYEKVTSACALKHDIDGFPEGDLTIVGERGVGLSGGQRARVSLARAVYANADVILLDNPLSAVDRKVSDHIFTACICGLLSDKARVLVSHNEFQMKAASNIIVLCSGAVFGQGSFLEMKESGLLETVLEENEMKRKGEIGGIQHKGTVDVLRKKTAENNYDHSDESCNDGPPMKGLEISEEDRMVGDISSKLYWEYLTSSVPTVAVIGLIALLLIFQAIVVSPDIWLSYLIRQDYNEQQNLTNYGIYAMFVTLTFLCSILRAYLFFVVVLKASERLHNKMVTAILKAPVFFFDTNPVGRVLNRFSKDTGSMDELLPMTFFLAVQVLLLEATAVVLSSLTNYWIIFAVTPLIVLFVLIVKYFLKSSLELKRLESVCRSPVFSHFSETLDGLDTIRSRRRQQDFIEQFYEYQDQHNRAFFMVLACARWLGVRLDLLCSLFIGAVAFAAAFLSQDATLAGLSLVYVMDTANLAQFSVRQLSEVENLMTSVERVLTYTKLESEPGYDNETRPPEGWPDDGSITFSNVSLRYHRGGPRVLKNVNLNIYGKAKIGIVGRTGAGKSSIVASLLRMPDADGVITIDGVDIKSLNLQECRRCISVLGQNPVIFSGTLRKNLDPLERHDDDTLWAVLEEVKLKSLVQNLKRCLDFEISERGANLSVGEQQLVCLARVLVEGNKIIILDEPTAHVDPKTERAIQETVHNKLQGCTIITIAHHLTTIKDCDEIFVFQNGEVAESGTYEELLAIDGGVFASMAEL